MRLLQNPWIPLLVQLLQAHIRGKLRFWHLPSPWWDLYQSHKSGTCLALRVTGESSTFGWGWWVPSLRQQRCPLCPPCALWGWLTVQVWQLHVAARASWDSLYFSKQRKCPPMPPTAQDSSAHQKEHNTRGRWQWKNWCVWESDNTGLKKGCIFFWVGRKLMIFKDFFHLLVWMRKQEDRLPGRCCMICWQKECFLIEP